MRELILRFARENSHWGYVRIVGGLRKLGVDVSATLVRNVLKQAGIPPAPKRGQLDWRTFLRQHAATTLDVRLLHRRHRLVAAPVRLFFISIGTRSVEYMACTSNPDGRW